MELAKIVGAAFKPVLLAEDSADDALLMQRAWRNAEVEFPLVHAWNGEEAMQLLRGQGELPCLVVLDIKMPRRGGFEVLEWIKANPDLKGLPVVMLSSSALAADRSRAQELGADDYYVKPTSLKDLVDLARALRNRCLDC